MRRKISTGGSQGPVFARDALIHSRNVPAVTLLAQVGTERFRNWLEAAGVEGLRPAREYGLALALGSGEATMEELVGLYAMLANTGLWRELVTVPDSGRAALSSTPDSPGSQARKRLLSAEASFMVLDMLRDVPRPEASALASGQRQSLAWKTGTSFGFRDAWSIGVVGNYVLAVWTGNFDGSANPALVGRLAAAPLFFAIADSLGGETARDLWWTATEKHGPASDVTQSEASRGVRDDRRSARPLLSPHSAFLVRARCIPDQGVHGLSQAQARRLNGLEKLRPQRSGTGSGFRILALEPARRVPPRRHRHPPPAAMVAGMRAENDLGFRTSPTHRLTAAIPPLSSGHGRLEPGLGAFLRRGR